MRRNKGNGAFGFLLEEEGRFFLNGVNPHTEQRYKDLSQWIPDAIEAAHRGDMIVQKVCGGYMYLRSLIGPEELLYMFYDDPELIHVCMQKWPDVADAVLAYHQQYITLDEIYFGEDITYNMGPLISPDMIRESIGFNAFSPFEVASGSDVLEIGKKFPDIVMAGGIDKREFSKSREELEAYLDRVLPVMKKRGGYIPTCDHGVPAEADFDSYMYYRKRCHDMNTGGNDNE